MTKRFELSQNGTFHTVIDTVEDRPLIVLEFKENEFGQYGCFHMMVDIMNELAEENKQLKSEIIMLKTTIGRNEAYIAQLTHKGQWRTTSDETE